MNESDQISLELGPESVLDLERAARAVREGLLVIMPTETVYGLAGNALDPMAVARIYEAKERPRFNPLIVHLAELSDVARVAREIPPELAKLAEAFWPGPLTLVLPKRDEVPDLVTAGMPTVAVRIPRHPVARALITRAGVPLAAPSANRFMELSPTSVSVLSPAIAERAAVVLDGGPCTVGVESTIVAYLDGAVRCLRAGGIAIEELEKIVGQVPAWQAPKGAEKILAPGMMKRHYAPRTPCRLDPSERPAPGKRTGLLSFLPPGERSGYETIEVLSESGDLNQAAARLFAALARLDRGGLDEIHCHTVPDVGLGRAINDRLRRASE